MIEIITPGFLFRHPSASVLIPALRTVGNIVTGDDMQTQVNSIGKLDLLFNVFIFCTLMYIILLLSESVLSSVITLA
jgi:hypothetical protein